MPRPDKAAAVTEVRERLEGSSAALLTEYRGLTVAELARLRRELRNAGAEYKVVKNTLARIAARDAGMDVPDDVLTGPTAVAFCADDPVAVAKALRTFSRERPNLVVKGGILDGRYLSAPEALKLAELKSREEVLAQLAGLMQAIVAQPARLALASLSKAARLFAALQDKRVQSGEVAEAPAPTVDETPEPDSAEAAEVTEAADAAGIDAGGTAAPEPGEASTTEQPLTGEAAQSDDAPDTETVAGDEA